MIRSSSGVAWLAVACLSLSGCFNPVDETSDGGFGGGGGRAQGGGAGGGAGGGGVVCRGCIASNGTCVPADISSNSTATCGLDGVRCQACSAGQYCMGACFDSPAGGGAGGGGPIGGGGPSGGGGGGACDGCRLPSGTCVPLALTTAVNCGAQGAACQACAVGELCTNGACSSTKKQVGDSCFTDTECQQSLGSGGLCKRTTSSGNASYAGGYCTLRCGNLMCPSGSSCVGVLGSFGERDAICLDDCGQSDLCRSGGYACYRFNTATSACWISPLPSATGGGAGGGGGSPVGGGGPIGGGAPVGGGGGGSACDGCITGNGSCLPLSISQSSSLNCGAFGSICMVCGSNQFCSRGACLNVPTGGGGGPIGGGAGGGVPIGGGAGGGVPIGGGAGGGVPIGGGAGGGSVSCSGCFTANGTCVPLRISSSSTSTCGANGSFCASCAADQACIGGLCSGGPPVGGGGGSACDGCFVGGFCVPSSSSNTSMACGIGGVTCEQCGPGQQCLNFQCTTVFDAGTPGCSASTCAGCCRGSTCVPASSQSTAACGAGGAQCLLCATGQTCSAGSCVSTPDAGSSMVGSACSSDLQCRPPSAGWCIGESVFGQPTGWTGGTCTVSCGNSACPGGSTCLDVGASSGQSNPICLQSCPSPRQGQSTCRLGYTCELNFQQGTGGMCIPRCNTLGFECWSGTRCDANSGYCVP